MSNQKLKHMTFKQISFALILAALGIGCKSVKPVTPDASPEAVALLKYIHSISGKRTLSGQHNYPNTKDASTREATEVWGKTPAVYGQDFGFAAPGDKDAVAARPDIIAECKRQHELGSIITLCWHAVPPTADEPITFRPKPGADTNRLASVQGQLTDEQWNDLITPGTELYNRWCAQVDVIAGFLKQLQEARVPVLWRPYHEMNGDWFWWGGRRGEKGTTVIYRQIFDRLVNHHKLRNLVWVWSVDRPSTPQRQFVDFFPGSEYFDIASLDVYHSDYAQSYYDELLRLAGGKPIALAEVGPPPTLEVLKKQPKWTWWMLWAEMVRERGNQSGTNNAVRSVVHDSISLSLDDPEYVNGIARIRTASGLPPLQPAKPAAQ
jgi:mannan endo-1,4-beta-mannosidase